jgi:hypothetical protein
VNAEDPKRKAIQDQLNSKIHWDAPEWEVLEWLSDKHQIEGDEAESMIAIAMKKRVAAIRERAIYAAFFASIGMGISGVFLWMEWLAQRFYIIRTIIALGGFFACTVWLLLSMVRLFSGKTDSTIDH